MKINDCFGVFPCFHVVCDACNRQMNMRHCPLCRAAGPLIRDSKQVEESSQSINMELDEESKASVDEVLNIPGEISYQEAQKLSKNQLLRLFFNQDKRPVKMGNLNSSFRDLRIEGGPIPNNEGNNLPNIDFDLDGMDDGNDGNILNIDPGNNEGNINVRNDPDIPDGGFVI